MTATLRLLADDLTGALDTAAEFVGRCGPVHVAWSTGPADAEPPSLAFDTGTRELGEAAACRIVTGLVPFLTGAAIAFKKVDSLIRGQTLPELAAVARTGSWSRVVLAPAFPFQGRTTRGGRQRAGGEPVGPNLVDALRQLGIVAFRARPGEPLRPGVSVFDSETDVDLEAVVAGAGATARDDVLWCGTGGLARALCAAHPVPPCPPLPRPVLGLFGSDQVATARQLAECAPHWTVLPHGEPGSAAVLAAGLARHGVALASLDLPPGVPRDEAARRIGAEFAGLLGRLPRPGTLAVAGGETLRGLCVALGAAGLRVHGRAVPGVPVSTVVGGPWDGVAVLSKSGAFGHPTLLRELLALPERIPA